MRAFMLFCSFIGCATQLSAMDQHIANYIFTHAQNSIDRIEEDKLFLNPQHIHLKDGHIYLETLSGDLIDLPMISSNGLGFYLALPHAKQQKYWKCVKCAQDHRQNDKPARCDRCGHPILFFYYK